MSVLIVLFFLFMLIVVKVAVGDVISKTSINIYLLWWFLWLLLSTFNPYGLYAVSSSTYLLLLLNVFMFSFGYILFGIMGCKSNHSDNLENSFSSLITKNIKFKVLLMSLLVVACHFYLKYLTVVQFVGGAAGRSARFEIGDLFASNYEYYVFGLILTPFSEMIILVIGSLILFQRNNILLFFCLLFLFLFGSIGSGRGIFINLVLSLIFLYSIKNKIAEMGIFQNNFGRKKYGLGVFQKAFILILVILVSLVLSFTTAQRMGYSDMNKEALVEGLGELGKQSIWYMTGPFRALDYAISHDYTKITGLYYGRATFAGFDSLIKMLIHGFGGTYEAVNDVILPLLQNDRIQISDEININFAYTSLMIHLFDFNVLGVVIFPFLFGLFARKMCFKFIEAPSFPMLVLNVYIMRTMIMTVFKWQYQFNHSIILLLLLFLLHKSQINRQKEC